ncbi:MAG: DNA mismatch repair protein MutS [Lutibacter sp.]|uniref:MutS-related protein n=1 Tax=Lutibacter sp. TaxID=1925666 RepID=UPI00299E6F67|nr:DNA mismatch repair protein MutS [Lutibacter sp.]MDX1828523.1 DNA mismatch repair protein MutS [Lutibacter sp.]
MQNPIEFYTAQKLVFEKKLADLKQQLAISSTLRIVVFLGIIYGNYFFFRNIQMMVLISIIGIALFFFLILRHTKLQYKSNFNAALLEINNTEINVLNGDYLSLDQGTEFTDHLHFYSYDIDLFGKGSFFQYCNRTATSEGKKKLANYLTENNISGIKKKQEGIIELSKKVSWRQQFSALASLVKVEYPVENLMDWFRNYKLVFPKYVAVLPTIFSLVSFILIILTSFQIIPSKILLLWFLFGLGIVGSFYKKVNILYKYASNAKDTFQQYYKLLNEIETTSFSSEILKEKQQEIQTEVEKASKIVAKFSKLLDALDQRNNLIVGPLVNGFLLWDLQQSYKIEKWINSYHEKVDAWFKVITFFDAQNSLANFVFNHPTYVFPEINSNKKGIESKKLGHVLIKDTSRISNDFKIENHQFFVITGANMAGKSTFLRTVSMAIVMANVGLPVCADKFKYAPIKLITSMRSLDSLVDNESYFFSELKRLKFIVDKIENEDYFIVLDEILKGTNSTDKAIGSKKFVQKLVESKSTGIIATHDLSLCEIENELPEVKNYYFDAEIINDELNFDYKLKRGICKNMNASFLLAKMKIV